MTTQSPQKSSSNKPITFVRAPYYFLQRTDISSDEKLIVSHIHTRSRTKTPSGLRFEWEVIAQEISNSLGINKMEVSRVMKKLIGLGILIFQEKRLRPHARPSDFPSNIYLINREKLKVYMKCAVTPSYRYGNTQLPHTVTPSYLKEDKDLKEDIEKKAEGQLTNTSKDNFVVGKSQAATAPAGDLIVSGKSQPVADTSPSLINPSAGSVAPFREPTIEERLSRAIAAGEAKHEEHNQMLRRQRDPNYWRNSI